MNFPARASFLFSSSSTSLSLLCLSYLLFISVSIQWVGTARAVAPLPPPWEWFKYYKRIIEGVKFIGQVEIRFKIDIELAPLQNGKLPSLQTFEIELTAS